MARALTTAVMLATTTLTGSAVQAGGPVGPPEQLPVRCDLDGDLSTLDVVVAYRLMHMTHNEKHVVWSIAETIANSGLGTEATESTAQVVAVGDFKPGGPCEVLWESGESEFGPTTLIAGEFRLPTLGELQSGTPSLPHPWRIAATTDFSGDGVTDLLWWNPQNAELLAWIGAASGGWYQVSVVGGPPPSNHPWRPVAAAMLDGYGQPGVFWQSADPSDPLWYDRAQVQQNGALVLHSGASVAALHQTGATIRAVGDLNQDGSDDLLWQDDATQRLRVCFLAGRTLLRCDPLIPDGFEDPTMPADEYEWRVVGPR
jgi:hypothetical protein